jgi:hypothetical protein
MGDPKREQGSLITAIGMAYTPCAFVSILPAVPHTLATHTETLLAMDDAPNAYRAKRMGSPVTPVARSETLNDCSKTTAALSKIPTA